MFKVQMPYRHPPVVHRSSCDELIPRVSSTVYWLDTDEPYGVAEELRDCLRDEDDDPVAPEEWLNEIEDLHRQLVWHDCTKINS